MPKGENRAIASYLSRVVTTEQTPAPKNRVEVRIGGDSYTIVAPESEEYIRKIAAYVDEKVTAITRSSHMSASAAAVLAACNIADTQMKATETADNLRSQIQDYVDDINRLRLENAELRREITQMKKAEEKE